MSLLGNRCEEALALDGVKRTAQLKKRITAYQKKLDAGDLDGASGYYDSALVLTLDQADAFHTQIALLEPLFTNGLDAPPPLADAEERSRRITDLSCALAMVGRVAESTALRELVLRLDVGRRAAVDAMISLVNCGLAFIDQRSPAKTLRCYELAAALAEAVAPHQLTMVRGYQLDVLVDIGRLAEAEAILKTVDRTGLTDDARADLALVRLELLERQGGKKIAAGRSGYRAAERAAREAVEASGEPEQRRSLLARLGHIALQRGEVAEAVALYEQSCAAARETESVNLAASEIDLAVGLARAGRADEARAAIQRAQATPAGGMRLCSDLAAAFLAIGDRDAAREHALAGYEEAWGDGPPFAFARDLETARGVLETLGVTPPRLPPCDPARARAVPCEAEIVAWIEELGAL
jgi:tetratricopeptide (TPR) repeat protein